jgi:hypothetical protein
LQDFAERTIDGESLFDDSDEHINRNSNPDLGLHCILGSPIKSFDSKILFDPFEEEFDLPTTLEKKRNG